MKLFQVVPGGIQFEKNLDRQKGERGARRRCPPCAPPATLAPVTEGLRCPAAFLEPPPPQGACCASPGTPRGPTSQPAPSISSACLTSAQVTSCPGNGAPLPAEPGVSPGPGAASAAACPRFGASARLRGSSQPRSPAASWARGGDQARTEVALLQAGRAPAPTPLPFPSQPTLPAPQAGRCRGSW